MTSSAPTSRTARRLRAASTTALAVLLAMLLSSCGVWDALAPEDAPAPSAVPAAEVEEVYESQFTRDGTFQSHIDLDGVDLVYTLWPTKSTPRTHEWHPRGAKYFSFTLQAYDLRRELRDPFRTKRRTYLSRIRVTSRTRTSDGSPSQRPYTLDAEARRITFDPEPVTTARGMLITSPKGAFELRNQRIGEMADDTYGLDLTLRAVVHIERAPGSDTYDRHVVRQNVPVAIFASDQPTAVTSIPVNAN